jgi:hypothetical protein
MSNPTQDREFPYGKYKGTLLSVVAKKDPKYMEFIYYKSGYDGWIKNWIWEHMSEIKSRIEALEE